MKLHSRVLSGSKPWIVCGILCVTSLSHSVHPQQTNADAKKAQSNAAPAVVTPPPSVFTIPHTEQEGMRDPFFPRSRRIFAHAPVQAVTNVSVVKHAELKLQGISGPPNHRLPIINGKTFELNEEAEVSTPEGRVPVRIIKIEGDTVTVQSLGERQTLKLRTGL